MVKGIGNFQRNSAIAKAVLLSLAGILVFGTAFSYFYTGIVNKGLADNLIRLHVIANSDTAEDQALKRDVRDAVLGYMRDKLRGTRDIEQTKYIISSSMDEIKGLAAAEIEKHGKKYTVEAVLGSYPFPTKSYGDVTLPAGSYQALRIVIGKGDGANWWCILFPPLCFVDATHGMVPESAKQDLKKVLTEDEYRMIVTADSDEEIPVKVRFKVVEFFRDTRIRFSGMISKLFK